MYLIGQGIDIHKLVKRKQQVNQKLGGINIKTNYKVEAHSDGDLILHAISDAILGALGLGDIGKNYNDNDSKIKDIDSWIILKDCLNKMEQHNYSISNMDITIVCEYIIFKPFIDNILVSLKQLLKTQHINIKVKRYEEEKSYIECNVVVLLKNNNKGK